MENLKKKAILVAQSEEPDTLRGTRSQTFLSKSPIIIDFQFNKLKLAKASLRNEVNTRKRVSRRAAKDYTRKLQSFKKRMKDYDVQMKNIEKRSAVIKIFQRRHQSVQQMVMSQQAHLEVTWILL